MRLIPFVLASLASATLMGANSVFGTSPFDSWDVQPVYGFLLPPEDMHLCLPGSTRRTLLRAARIQTRRKLDGSGSEDDSGDGSRTVVVGTDDDKCNDEDPDYSTIGRALAEESSGVTIQLCAETYQEAIEIDAGYNVKIKGAQMNRSIIKPPSGAAGAVIGAGNNSIVQLEELTLDGTNGLDGSVLDNDPDIRIVAGFICQDCDASFKRTKITNIRDTEPDLSPSFDIFVRSNSTIQDYDLKVEESVFPNSGSFGILADGSAVKGVAMNNEITKGTSIGENPSVGIQVSRQADMVVERNFVSNFGDVSSAITLFCPGRNSDVSMNQIDSSNIGINLINAVTVDVQDNVISNVVGAGVLLQQNSTFDPGCDDGQVFQDFVEDNIVKNNTISCVSPSLNFGVASASNANIPDLFNNTIDSNMIADCGFGVSVLGDESTIKNNDIDNASVGGVLHLAGIDNFIQSNDISDSAQFGVALVNGQGITVSQSLIDNISADPPVVGFAGITIQFCNNCVIKSNNVFDSAPNDGIFLFQTSNALLEDNVIDLTNIGVNIFSPSTGTTVKMTNVTNFEIAYSNMGTGTVFIDNNPTA